MCLSHYHTHTHTHTHTIHQRHVSIAVPTIFSVTRRLWIPKMSKSINVPVGVRLRLKCYGTRAETRFPLSAKRTCPFKLAGASVHSTAGSRGVRISGSNAGYSMLRGSVKSTCYSLHSLVFPSHPLLCVTVCHHISPGLYTLQTLQQQSRWLAKGRPASRYRREKMEGSKNPRPKQETILQSRAGKMSMSQFFRPIIRWFLTLHCSSCDVSRGLVSVLNCYIIDFVTKKRVFRQAHSVHVLWPNIQEES